MVILRIQAVIPCVEITMRSYIKVRCRWHRLTPPGSLAVRLPHFPTLTPDLSVTGRLPPKQLHCHEESICAYSSSF